MKTFSQCLEEAKTVAAEFVRHSAYDKEFKTVECQRCGKKVFYSQFLMSGICHDCAAEEDLIDMRADALRRMDERELLTTHQNDNMTSSL
jgi:hypothetical protein